MSRTRWNTNLVSEMMKKENCVLLDEYKRGDLRIKYLFENKEYSVRWNDWVRKIRPSRPHLKGGNRNTKLHEKWDNEKVNELFKKENCELVDEYKNTKQRLRYKFNNSYYWTTLDDWIYHSSRPHLYINQNEQKFKDYLEKNDIEFETQQSFNCLKSNKNYKLRFDFFIPSLNLLIEIDDRSHANKEEQIINGEIKDDFCEKNQIKLLRIDTAVKEEEYDELLTKIIETNIYILRYGKLYRRCN